MTIEQVLNKFRETHPLADTKLIEEAYHFALEAHAGQIRLNQEPTIEHLLQTAYTLAELRLDPITLSAGFLHDIIEDTSLTIDKIKKRFGDEIAFLVESMTNLDRIKKHYDFHPQAAEKQTDNLRKIFFATAKDVRVILIKLADRLHNMKTLSALPNDRQIRLAWETLEVYAPIAYRLGLRELTGELEDLAFPYVYPKEYKNLTRQVKEKYEEGKKYLQKITPLIKDVLKNKKISVIEIHTRIKRYYSLYRKLLRYDMNWHRIYDLVALRIVVPDIESCYATLGIIHKRWKPLIGRIKDYIALPKPNGYQSIHTTVFCEDGKITEFQIRTPQMHLEAELGIAAYWQYQEEKGIKAFIKKNILRIKPKEEIKKEIYWVKQLQNWQKEKFNSPQEFLDALKIDFLKNRIFVFTPTGEIIELPEDATPIDFAYQIHTDIGHKTIGVKINGQINNLDKLLENGDLVEIILGENKKPNFEWLKFAKTHHAKKNILAWFKKTKAI